MTETTTAPIPYFLADAPAPLITHPQTSRGWAILLPDGRLWREPIHYVTHPHDTTPDIWPTKAAAASAMRELVKLVSGTYGARDYMPSLVQVELAEIGLDLEAIR